MADPDFPDPAAECMTCRGTGRVSSPDPDRQSLYDSACPDCGEPYMTEPDPQPVPPPEVPF